MKNEKLVYVSKHKPDTKEIDAHIDLLLEKGWKYVFDEAPVHGQLVYYTFPSVWLHSEFEGKFEIEDGWNNFFGEHGVLGGNEDIYWKPRKGSVA